MRFSPQAHAVAVTQLNLDLSPPHYPEFGRFLGAANTELHHVLHHEQAPLVYVWGPQGCGKAYVLRAWVHQAQACGLRAEYVDARTHSLPAWETPPDCVAIHQTAHLDAAAQAHLFTLLNDYRRSGQGRLLISAEEPPAALPLREDVRTRLATGLVYELHPLSDADKIRALGAMAQTRQLAIDDKILSYLLTHWRRDLDSLLDILATLEHHPLAHKRRIGPRLLQEIFKQEPTTPQEPL